MRIILSKVLAIALLFTLIPLPAQEQPLPTSTQVSASLQRQVMCLAKNIYYESAMESYEGKLAVAQVTINRTNNSSFPSDFCSVVYQKTGSICQFSWTCLKDLAIKNKYAWEECLMIAKMALTDNSLHDELAKSNALFYHATYIHPGWTNIRVVMRIGNHIFYRKA